MTRPRSARRRPAVPLGLAGWQDRGDLEAVAGSQTHSLTASGPREGEPERRPRVWRAGARAWRRAPRGTRRQGRVAGRPVGIPRLRVDNLRLVSASDSSHTEVEVHGGPADPGVVRRGDRHAPAPDGPRGPGGWRDRGRHLHAPGPRLRGRLGALRAAARHVGERRRARRVPRRHDIPKITHRPRASARSQDTVYMRAYNPDNRGEKDPNIPGRR